MYVQLTLQAREERLGTRVVPAIHPCGLCSVGSHDLANDDETPESYPAIPADLGNRPLRGAAATSRTVDGFLLALLSPRTYISTIMKLTELFIAQLERETAISRRVLARVPEGQPDWKPHEKSMPLGYLATLVATMPGWIAMTVLQGSLDLNPAGGATYRPPQWKTTADLTQNLEQAAAQAREALAGTTDEHLLTTWRLMEAGRTLDESPRHVVISDTFTHIGHHRGQLTVYLRLNNVAVPSVYGPTADEGTWNP